MDRRASRLHLDFPPELPISARAEEITAAIQRHPVVIVAGETGSGKTTQLPKLCLAAGRGAAGRIACTQPRRVAALSISRRVAAELGVPWGREVGCRIRFTDQTSPATVIKFLTDGMLLAELQGDPLLREYDTIILDEAHERSLNIDFLLGHLRQLRFRRPELRTIITSATIDTEAFSRAFDDAPVIEVSGRLYPVEVIYAPLDELGPAPEAGAEPAAPEARAETLHYIDGAVEAVGRILRESPAGDLLIFMPAERDIRETCDLLAGREFAGTEVIPLFGRLTNAEQQRVFAPTQRRKIVVATNVAETSLTIPGIRFVVDTGLARISRYAPQARTRRLPIEPIAQSSADQRKGRCGRVADGVCIRLFSEADFRERPRFSQPEIQRCNLADVILRLKVFGLGDIERFPFLNAPPAKAVRAGYQLLEELGAVTPAGDGGPGRELTDVGRELARLPVDPTVGRMILRARGEKCLREVLVIAAGLSIQDPRDRPLDRQAQADAAHRRFAHPDSDFLTLLNLWEAFHDEVEALTQNRLRRFCQEHFLSYVRMREWRDIHDQLRDVLEERDDFRLTSVRDGLPRHPRRKSPEARLEFGSPGYRAIHRSVLAGLLGNIAMLDEATGAYRAAHDRRAALFPGSGLYVKPEARKREGPAAARASAGGAGRAPRAPRWIMAAEMVETARLYARTAARIDPAWALELGAHLLKVSHTDPTWDAEAGRVQVRRHSRLYGLELEARTVSYGAIDPRRATEIFIREGLVADTVTWPFDFLAHNRKVREKIATILTRTRSSGYLDLDEAVYQFYASRLLPPGKPAGAAAPSAPAQRDEGVAPPEPGVSSVPELIDLVRVRRMTEPAFLQLTAEDLRGAGEAAPDEAAFPDALPLENRVLPLDYAYRPGGEEDGVTLTVPAHEFAGLTPAALDWAVPGHLEEKVLHRLRALPTGQRRQLVPLAATAKAAAAAVAEHARRRGHQDPLADTLAAHLRAAHRLAVDPAVWAAKPLPDHLRVRVQVVDEQGRPLAASRDLAEVRRRLEERLRALSAEAPREDPDAWRRARARWEKEPQTSWTFGDVPARVAVGDQAGVPVYAYPAPVPEAAGVALRLRRSPEAAAADGRRGLLRLFELELRYELAWLERDLRGLRAVGVVAATFAPVERLQAGALAALRQWACGRAVAPLTAPAFARELAQARAGLRGVVPKLTDLLREILTLRQALLTHPQPYPGLAEELAALLPADFIAATPFPRLAHLPRYLQAMKIRADRWRQNAARDAERAQRVAPYVQAVAAQRRSGAAGEGGERFRWLVEEFRVSVFAQELGTAEPVSPVRLDRALQALRAAGPAPGAPDPPPAAAPAPVAAPPRGGPLKSLGALDRLFPRG
jgi:ATP-dependent RNA helicase HrpA